jgi:hypothetical protein
MGDSLRLGLRTRVLDAESMGEMGDRRIFGSPLNAVYASYQLVSIPNRD